MSLYIDRIDDDSADGPFGLWRVEHEGEGTRDVLLSRGTFVECYEEARRLEGREDPEYDAASREIGA